MWQKYNMLINVWYLPCLLLMPCVPLVMRSSADSPVTNVTCSAQASSVHTASGEFLVMYLWPYG